MADAPKKILKRNRKQDQDSIESRSTDGSDDGKDLEGFVVDEVDSSESPVNEEELAIQEAKAFVGNVPSATIGRYSLRDRSKIRKVEVYFDEENALLVAKNQDKAEMLQLLKKWKASNEYVGEVELKKSSTYEQVSSEYLKAKAALNLPDSDIEEDEEDDDDEDEDEEEDEEDEDEDEDDEDDDDDDDDDEDDDEDGGA